MEFFNIPNTNLCYYVVVSERDMRLINVICVSVRLLVVISFLLACLLVYYYFHSGQLTNITAITTITTITTITATDSGSDIQSLNNEQMTISTTQTDLNTIILSQSTTFSDDEVKTIKKSVTMATESHRSITSGVLSKSTPSNPPITSSVSIMMSSSPSMTSMFPISHNLHWPQPRAVRAINDILHEQWLADLKECISMMTSREVIMLTSNQQYTEVLLNWLIVAVARASVKLSQVLVISMDMRLHLLLKERGVNSVLVKSSSLLTSNVIREGIFPTVMMTRLSIIRLLNHWGYDVINYDIDAVLLRDPSYLLHHLHSNYHIIGTFGRFPKDLTKKWGITLCTAWLVVRSSPVTEEFWEAMSRVAVSSYSDQGKMNYGLEAMNVHWELPSHNLASITHSVEGIGRNNLRISLLPYNIACRASSCTSQSLKRGLYIWHRGGPRAGESKRQVMEEGRVWFLRSDWTEDCGLKQEKEWLKCISNDRTIFT